MSIVLRDAGFDDYAWIECAIQGCSEAMMEFGAFYGSATSKLSPLVVGDRSVLMIVDDGQTVGFVDVDPDPDLYNSFHITYFVAHECRRRRLATQALVLLGSIRPKSRLVAAVRPSNVASLATAHAAGFIEVGRDRWGSLVLRRPADNPSTPP